MQRKWVIQFSIQAILALVGLGAAFVPQVNTWLPTVITWGIASVWSITTLVLWQKDKHKVKTIAEQAQPMSDYTVPLFMEFKDSQLLNTLNEMHKRMITLKNVRLSKVNLNMKQLEAASPILMDKLGIVKLDEWPSFRKNLAKRIKKQIPKNPKRNENWYYRVLSASSEIQKELCASKEWGIEDLNKIAEWWDSQHWGLGELRDRDKRWNELYESIKPFTLDDKIRELIERHMSYSYCFCSGLLVYGYSAKWPNNLFLALLYATLVGSPISPTQIDLELSKILAEIGKQMKAIK